MAVIELLLLMQIGLFLYLAMLLKAVFGWLFFLSVDYFRQEKEKKTVVPISELTSSGTRWFI